MKIFGNCLVKNEADMIVETLEKAAVWCDRIFVFDNGSTDGTWERVLALARREPRVVPFKTSPEPFRNSLRRDAFERYGSECTNDDWWCVLDADEIYVDDPRTFLAGVPRRHHVVWGVYFQHYFTDIDVARYAEDPGRYPPHTPAEQALRYYRCDYSEVRFYRHRRRLQWDAGSAPRHLGVVHPRRIRFKHYQYRSPAQIEQRLRTRQQAIASGAGVFQGYCDETDWRQKVVLASTCRCIDDPDAFTIEDDKLPSHLEPAPRRAAKLLLHGLGLWP